MMCLFIYHPLFFLSENPVLVRKDTGGAPAAGVWSPRGPHTHVCYSSLADHSGAFGQLPGLSWTCWFWKQQQWWIPAASLFLCCTPFFTAVGHVCLPHASPAAAGPQHSSLPPDWLLSVRGRRCWAVCSRFTDHGDPGPLLPDTLHPAPGWGPPDWSQRSSCNSRSNSRSRSSSNNNCAGSLEHLLLRPRPH